MSEGEKKRLYGNAFKKSKILARLARFAGKKLPIETDLPKVSNAPDTSVECSDANSFSEKSVPTDMATEKIQLNCHSGDEPPFLGFEPVEELRPCLQGATETLATDLPNVSAAAANVPGTSVECGEVNSFSGKSVATEKIAVNCDSGEEPPFFGFGHVKELRPLLERLPPNIDNILKNMKSRDEIHPLRLSFELKEKFSLDVDGSIESDDVFNIASSTKRKASDLPMTPLLSKRSSIEDLSSPILKMFTMNVNPSMDSQDFLGFPSLPKSQSTWSLAKRFSTEDIQSLVGDRQSKVRRSLYDSCPDIFYGNFTQCTPQKANGTIEEQPLQTNSFADVSAQVNDIPAAAHRVREQEGDANAPFYELVTNAHIERDYKSGSDLCVTASVVALIYNEFKIVDTWNALDLDLIFEQSCGFHADSLTAMQIEGVNSSPIDIFDLIKEFEFVDDKFVVIPAIARCAPIAMHYLDEVLQEFESSFFKYGILTIRGEAFGVIKTTGKRGHIALYDIVGQREDAFRSGTPTKLFSAAIYFVNARQLFTFILEGSETEDLFTFYGIKVEKLPSQTKAAPAADFDKLPGEFFYRKVLGNFCQFAEFLPTPHHQCTAMSAAALAYQSIKSAEEWDCKDLDMLMFAGQAYYQLNLNDIMLRNDGEIPSGATFLEAIKLTPLLEIEKMSFTVEEYHDLVIGGAHCERATLTNAIKRFEEAKKVTGIITYNDYSYGLIRCARANTCSAYTFFDSHGRDDNGHRGGSHSAILHFNNAEDFVSFFISEFPLRPKRNTSVEDQNSLMIVLVPLTIICNSVAGVSAQVNDIPANASSAPTVPFERIIRGTIAQDDLSFTARRRNAQCTANSVVFLAYTSLIENNWRSMAIDLILHIGDDLYAFSYANAITIRPRNDRYISADEVYRKIVISLNGWKSGEVTVVCEPVMELSGRFGDYARSYIERFFAKQIYGVFVSSSKSVALYRFDSTYVLFDPHARNADGFYEASGTANIFFFRNIKQLHAFLCREGYNPIREFTLTAFTFRKETNSKNVPQPVPVANLAEWKVPSPGDDFDEEDDIPLINLSLREWSPDDDIPLCNFKSKKDNFTSKDLPLNRKKGASQSSGLLTVRSAPEVKRDGSSFQRPSESRKIERLRHKRKNAKYTKRINMLPDEEQQIHLRWSAYLKRYQRTGIAMHFQDPIAFEKAIAYHKKCMEDATDDEELVKAADAAVATVERNEERIRQRLINRELNPTHFMAFCSHEDVDETDPMYNVFTLSPMDNVCEHCGALYFAEERNSRGVYTGCCGDGKYWHDLPEKQNTTYPHVFKELLTGQSVLSREFREQILEYNNVFSFGSLGASDFRHMDRSGRLGVAVKVHGMIYHNAEYFLTNSNGEGLPPAQLYYIGNNEAVDARNSLAKAPLNRSLLLRLQTFLRANNPYAGAYRMMTEVLRAVRNQPNPPPTNVNLQIFQVRHSDVVATRRDHRGDFSFPTTNEVAAVYTSPPAPGTKNIVIFPSNVPVEGGIAIASSDPNRDSYLYPVLFPFGEQTWSYRLFRDVIREGPNARKRITLRDFYAFLFKTRKDMFSPVLNAGKLSQQFIIDAWTRVQENQMEYMKSAAGQKKLRAETYGALKDYIENSSLFKPGLPGRVIPMPVDFVGSRRYIKEKYLDAMAVCSKYKRPSYFITLTLNPFCKAVMNHIPKGGNPVDFPEITSRVFQLIVNEMVDDLKKKNVMGVCEALIYVIEWQKRSNHHAHFILFVQEEDRPANAIDVDGFVSAEIPCPVAQPRLYKAVTAMMNHEKCGAGTDANCMIPNEKGGGMICKKGFPKKYSEQSELVESKSPIYRRRLNGRTFTSKGGNVLDNRWIVPYNPYLLLKYDCHLNIEVVATVDVLKYLFKYFFKGFDWSKIMFDIVDGEQVYDEFKHYVDCRYLNAMEAMWRILSFTIHYNDHAVYRLPVHLENYQRVIFDADRDVAESLARNGSELIAYFKLNEMDASAAQYSYVDIPYHYTYNTKTKAWQPRLRQTKKLATRLVAVNYNQIEMYSLRLLLLSVRGARSYEEIRNVRGTQHDTFHSAAIALGLLQDDDMQKRTFEEVVHVEMPYRIRCLFANLLIFITPSDPLAFWNTYKSKMYEDFVRRKYSANMAEQLALRHISSLLALAGFTNTAMKLPEPHFDNDAEKRQADAIAAEFVQNQFDQVEEAANGSRMAPMLNVEQKRFFDRVMHCVNTPNEQKLFFLDGPGGTGKTFLNRTILSTLRGMGKICTVTVFTGIGSSLYKGGRTVHSTFRFPLDVTGPVTSNVSTTSDTGAQLRRTEVLIWDEISQSNKHMFNAVDELFRDLHETPDKPFGGIVVITSGDFRQTLPIFPRASRSEIINALVKRSNSWRGFEKHALRINMRLENPDDVAFSEWLVEVGDGKRKDYPSNNYYDSYVKVPPECVSPASLVDSIYGQTFRSCDIQQYCKYVILATHHEDVEMLNNLIYSRMTEDVCTEKTYYSTDSITNADPNGDDMFDSTVLNELNPKGTAPHKLVLRQNCIIMLLRNLNPFDGFANGTRLFVKKLYDNCIVGEIISGENAGKVILIPRIRMTAKVDSISEELLRIQFPVKLCFAMTIDKSQSQSFESVGVFLRKAPFAHGQLYVALSRTRFKANLKLQVFSDALMGKLDPKKPDIYVPNIVYREAL